MVIFLIVFVIRYMLLILKEEKKLLAVFPGAYQEYCKKVPRILPKFSSIINLDISAYLPIKISWLYKEIGSIVTLLLLVLLAVSWEGIYRLGVWVYLKGFVWLLFTFILFIIFVILLSERTEVKNASYTNKS